MEAALQREQHPRYERALERHLIHEADTGGVQLEEHERKREQKNEMLLIQSTCRVLHHRHLRQLLPQARVQVNRWVVPL